MQIKDVQHFVDCFSEVHSFLCYVPVRLKAGSSDNRKDGLSNPGEKANISGGIIVEVILCKPHLEHEAHEEEHEEEDREDGVEDTSNKRESSEQLVEHPIEIGDPSTVFDLQNGFKLAGLIDDDLIDCLVSFKGISANKLSQGSHTFIYGEVVLIKFAAVLVVAAVLDQDGVLTEIVCHRVDGIRWIDEGVEGIGLVVAAVDEVLGCGAGHCDL